MLNFWVKSNTTLEASQSLQIKNIFKIAEEFYKAIIKLYIRGFSYLH